ncbi:MAG: RdgB/HAM1 family non-canonical purine NTP pyrophosphatase [Rhodothermaceae bacterium]
MKVIFATGNNGKAIEVKKLFENTEYEIVSLKDIGDNTEIIEDADTFEGNALIKAKVIYEKYKTPVIADDSGLMVEQLNNEPGVFSARYAGENCTYDDNNNKLLSELKNFPEPHPAKFVCAAVYYDGNTTHSLFGEFKGEIVMEKRGEKGFGYDPVFKPEGYEVTLAEMDLEEKNKISHRAIAFEKLKEKMCPA